MADFTYEELRWIARALDREWDRLEDRLEEIGRRGMKGSKVWQETERKIAEVRALDRKVDELKRARRGGQE